jgi:hypothetical protein
MGEGRGVYRIFLEKAEGKRQLRKPRHKWEDNIKMDLQVKSVLICGAETWSLYEDGRRRINATEMDALRRPARISKLD